MDEHVSHQNGLDVDVYYPRLDQHLSAPIATSQIDHDLAQDLLDRFVAAGVQTVFVGYSTGLRGQAASSSRTEPREPHAPPLPAANWLTLESGGSAWAVELVSELEVHPEPLRRVRTTDQSTAERKEAPLHS